MVGGGGGAEILKTFHSLAVREQKERKRGQKQKQKSEAEREWRLKCPPSRLEGEPGGVSSVAAQRAERPHDQFEAGVVDVPQVDVFVGDLHGALAVDVQVGGWHQVDVETL